MNVIAPWACRKCGKQNGTSRLTNMTPEKWKQAKAHIAEVHEREHGCQAEPEDILFWVRHGDCNQCGHCCQVVQTNFRYDLPGEIANAEEERFLKTRGYTIEGRKAWILTEVRAACPELDGPTTNWVNMGETYGCKVWEDRPPQCESFPITPAQVRGTPCSYWFEREDGRKVGGDDTPYPWRTDAEMPDRREREPELAR